MPLLASYQGLCRRLAQGGPPPGPLPPPARSPQGAAAPTRAPRLPSGPSAGEARPRAAPPQAEAMRWGPPSPPTTTTTTDLPRPVPASLSCRRPLLLLLAAAPRGPRGRGRSRTGMRGSAPSRRPPGMRGVQEAEAAVTRQRAPPGSGAWPPPALSRLSRLVERGGACRKRPPDAGSPFAEFLSLCSLCLSLRCPTRSGSLLINSFTWCWEAFPGAVLKIKQWLLLLETTSFFCYKNKILDSYLNPYSTHHISCILGCRYLKTCWKCMHCTV